MRSEKLEQTQLDEYIANGWMHGWYANDGPTELRYTHYNIKNEWTIANYGGWMDVWMFVVDSLAQANILKRISTFICETLVEFRYKKKVEEETFSASKSGIFLWTAVCCCCNASETFSNGDEIEAVVVVAAMVSKSQKDTSNNRVTVAAAGVARAASNDSFSSNLRKWKGCRQTRKIVAPQFRFDCARR